jgi:uroporphyrinogen-III synthase
MALPLDGRNIALAEGRQLEELAQMLEKEGATTLRCPMLNIVDAPDAGPVLAWLGDLTASRFHYVILMTGEALRRLLGFAEREGIRQDVITALAKVKTITRGPKPVRALKEIGLTPTIIADSPTTPGVIATLQTEQLQGKTVGLTLYAEPNPVLEDFLASSGATVRSVMPYVYAPRADAEQVCSLIEKMSRGEVDAILFTSSPQVDRLYEVAKEHGLSDELRQGLGRTCVAAVGPVVAQNLKERGAKVDICPEQGFVMKNLVLQIKRELAVG